MAVRTNKRRRALNRAVWAGLRHVCARRHVGLDAAVKLVARKLGTRPGLLLRAITPLGTRRPSRTFRAELEALSRSLKWPTPIRMGDW